MTWNKSNFILQYDPAEIPLLEAEYIACEGDDREMLDAGRMISNGDHSRANVEIICKWKSPRRIGLLSENTDADIRRALAAATLATDAREALEPLITLRGVAVKMGSAILTAIAPHCYSVFDYRALEALGLYKDNNSISCYLAYREACLELAKKYDVTLRGLDRANWQWSKRQSKRSDNCMLSLSCQAVHEPNSSGWPQFA